MNHTKQFHLRHQELYMFSMYNVLQEGVCDQVSSSLFTKWFIIGFLLTVAESLST